MLRIFRKWRKAQLPQNRLIRYLVYAIGEIVLVVIGILLALYLNDRRAEKQERRMEWSYLNRLQADLDQNITELDRVIAETERSIQASDSVIGLSLDRIPSVEPVRFWRLMGKLLEYTILRSPESTVEDIVGSGRLDLIRDPVIREAIATWKSGLLSIRSLEGDYKALFGRLADYYHRELPIYRYMESDGEDIVTEGEMRRLLSDWEFLNLVNYVQFPSTGLNGEYGERRRKLRELATRVTAEIQALESEFDLP